MKILGIFDWQQGNPSDVCEFCSQYFSTSINVKNKMYVLTEGEKSSPSTDIEAVISNLKSEDYSIEIYLNFHSKVNLDEAWDIYIYASISESKRKDLVIAVNDKIYNQDQSINLIRSLDQKFNINYGYLINSSNKNSRYSVLGISTGEESLEEMDSDARWFNERTLISSNGLCANRHMKGMLRSVYELNILNSSQYSNLTRIIGGDLHNYVIHLDNNKVVWTPNKQDIPKIISQLDFENLLI